jgi:hypothetical protein
MRFEAGSSTSPYDRSIDWTFVKDPNRGKASRIERRIPAQDSKRVEMVMRYPALSNLYLIVIHSCGVGQHKEEDWARWRGGSPRTSAGTSWQQGREDGWDKEWK